MNSVCKDATCFKDIVSNFLNYVTEKKIKLCSFISVKLCLPTTYVTTPYKYHK